MIEHEAIVIGAGLAGLRAALELNMRNVNVGILTRVHPVRSHSLAAQGGINAPLGNHVRGAYDSPEKHAFDTIKGSDYLADQMAALTMTKMASQMVYELEHWGCPFSRTNDGKIAQRPFGGAGFPRTCFAVDKTGHVILHTLFEKTCEFMDSAERENIKLYEEFTALSLIVEDDVCYGVVALNMRTGELEIFKSGGVIIASGGSGRMYRNTTNSLISTGLGAALAYWEEVALKDMEFIQFHPTSLYGTNILMTEGARGEGGYLLNNKGERFLANYPDSAKSMEIAPRDIVSRNMWTEIVEGRGFENAYVNLDLRHLGRQKIMERLPGIRDIAMNFAGVDPIEEPIPVQPGQHYTMGGIDCDDKGATSLKGLYAAGECACISVHGANRLGGNSLLDTLVFGALSGGGLAEYIQGGSSGRKPSETLYKDRVDRVDSQLTEMESRTEGELYFGIKEEMENLMVEKVGIFRDGKNLSEALSKIRELKERFKKVRLLGGNGRKLNNHILSAMDLKANLDTAETVIMGALEREESRGSHYRMDFKTRDDKKFLHHTLIYYKDGEPKLDKSEVDISLYEPKERKY